MSRIFLSIVLLFVVIAGFGQNTYPGEKRRTENNQRDRFAPTLGFSIGPSILFAHGGGWLRKYGAPKAGYSINMNVGHYFTKNLQGSLSIGYERKGLKGIIRSEERIFTIPVSQKLIMDLSLDYVATAFVIKHSILRSERAFIGAGPYFGYLAAVRLSSEVYLNGSLVTKNNGNPDHYFDYDEYDLGVSALIGHNIIIAGQHRGTIQMCYNHGMRHIDHPVIGQLRNASVALLFGITLSKNPTKKAP